MVRDPLRDDASRGDSEALRPLLRASDLECARLLLEACSDPKGGVQREGFWRNAI